MRIRTRRRRELLAIAAIGDVNDLTLTGHVEHQPLLRDDDEHRSVCEFMLTQTTGLCRCWEQQRYNIRAYGELGEYYTAHWQPGQAILIIGLLEHQLCDTLAGPLPSIQIVAQDIDCDLGLHPHRAGIE